MTGLLTLLFLALTSLSHATTWLNVIDNSEELAQILDNSFTGHDPNSNFGRIQNHNRLQKYLTNGEDLDLFLDQRRRSTLLTTVIHLKNIQMRHDFTFLLLQYNSQLANSTNLQTKTTILHEAVILKDQVVVRLLLDHGADTTAYDRNGLHAVDHAKGLLWDDSSMIKIFTAHDAWKCVQEKRYLTKEYRCGDVLSCQTVSHQFGHLVIHHLVVGGRKTTSVISSQESIELAILNPLNLNNITDSELISDVKYVAVSQYISCQIKKKGLADITRTQLYLPLFSSSSSFSSTSPSSSSTGVYQSLAPRDYIKYSENGSKTIFGYVISREETSKVTKETNATEYTILLDDETHYAIKRNVKRMQLRSIEEIQEISKKQEDLIGHYYPDGSHEQQQYGFFYISNSDETATILTWCLTIFVLCLMYTFNRPDNGWKKYFWKLFCCKCCHFTCNSLFPRAVSRCCLQPLNVVINIFLFPLLCMEYVAKYAAAFLYWMMDTTKIIGTSQIESVTHDVFVASKGIIKTIKSEFFLHAACDANNTTYSQSSSLLRSLTRVLSSAWHEVIYMRKLSFLIFLCLIIFIGFFYSPRVYSSVFGAVQTCLITLLGALYVFRNYYSLSDPTLTRPGIIFVSFTIVPIGYYIFAAKSKHLLIQILTRCRLRNRNQDQNHIFLRCMKITLEYTIRFVFNLVFFWVSPTARVRLVRSAWSGWLTIAVLYVLSLNLDDNNDGGVDPIELLHPFHTHTGGGTDDVGKNGNVNNALVIPWNIAFTIVTFTTIGVWCLQSFVSEQIQQWQDVGNKMKESRKELNSSEKELNTKKEEWKTLRQQSEGRRNQEREKHMEQLRKIRGLECAHCHANVATSINLDCGHCILCTECTEIYRSRHGDICPVPDCAKKSTIKEMAHTLTTCFVCYQGWESSCIFRPSSIGGINEEKETKGDSTLTSDRCDHLICVSCMVDAVRFGMRNKTQIVCQGSLSGLRCPMYAGGCHALVLEESISRLRVVSNRVLPDSRSQNNTKPLTIAEGDKFSRFLNEARIPVMNRLYCINPRCVDLAKLRNLNDMGSDTSKEAPTKFKCVFCNTAHCSRCKRQWHPYNLDCKAAHREKFDVTERNIQATTKGCPKCGQRVTHWHGHACHHIAPGTGCPNCKTHFCYGCGTAGKSSNSYCASQPKCRTYCISDRDIKNYLVTTSGYPVDTRCGCGICSDCRPGKPCKFCSGSCVVCKGYVKHGTFIDPTPNNVDESHLPNIDQLGVLHQKKQSGSWKFWK